MPTPAVKIRRATRRDRSAVLALHRALYVDMRSSITSPELARLAAYRDLDAALAADVDALLTRPEMRVLLAERGSEVVGYATARVVRDENRVISTRGLVEDWLVVPHARGRGVGRMLMERLFEVLEADGCGMVESSTLASNEGARTAHARMGFVETDVRMRRALGRGDER